MAFDIIAAILTLVAVGVAAWFLGGYMKRGVQRDPVRVLVHERQQRPIHMAAPSVVL